MKGSCLCGAVEITAADHHEIDVCHCSMCRRWSGGPMLAVHCGSDISFSGNQQPSVYRSSDWAERGFCPACGTHLFYRLVASDEYALTAGLFEADADFSMTSQIFIEEKPGYYAFANETQTLTGEQAFAQYSGNDS